MKRRTEVAQAAVTDFERGLGHITLPGAQQFGGALHTNLPEMLLDGAALSASTVSDPPGTATLAGIVSQQSFVLAVGDAYLALGVLSLMLVPVVLKLTYIPPPDTRPAMSQRSAAALTSQG